MEDMTTDLDDSDVIIVGNPGRSEGNGTVVITVTSTAIVVGVA